MSPLTWWGFVSPGVHHEVSHRRDARCTASRATQRNRTCPKTLSTKAGDLVVGILKLRRGSFFLSLVEPRRRIDQALDAVVMEADVTGVSTRSVADVVAAVGIEAGISKSEVSRICAGLDERLEACRHRALGHVVFPCLDLDATSVDVQDDALGQVVSRAVVVASGISTEAREVLGVDVAEGEDEIFWARLLRSLRDRGRAGSASWRPWQTWTERARLPTLSSRSRSEHTERHTRISTTWRGSIADGRSRCAALQDVRPPGDAQLLGGM